MRKTFIHFFTIADYEEEEKWLREKHNNGWKMVGFTLPCFYTFESCEPEDVIYRLDYRTDEQKDDYMQMLNDFGWEYFDEYLGWMYFRKNASEVATEDEGELFSDNESRTNFVSHIICTRYAPMVLLFLSCVLPNFTRIFSENGAGIGHIILSAVFGVLFILNAILIVYCGIKLKKIKDKYKTE